MRKTIGGVLLGVAVAALSAGSVALVLAKDATIAAAREQLAKQEKALDEAEAKINALVSVCRPAAARLDALDSSETLLVVDVGDSGQGLDLPIFGQDMRLSLPATAGRELILWRVPFRFTPEYATWGSSASVERTLYYYVSHDGKILGGPYLPEHRELVSPH